MSTNHIDVVGGVDTHRDNHVAAAVDSAGRLLGTASFPATGTGYGELLAWLASWGRLARVGVEGTGSYGAGLARHLAAPGVGPEVAATLLVTAGDNPQRMATNASFAALCGASPIEASSGQHIRHRLNRGGDRQANNALWRIAMVRLRYDERTIAYALRRTAQGKTRREIIRCLKHHIAREIHQLLTDSPPVPRGSHLRHLRHNAGVTLADAARALNTCTTHISQLERGIRHNHNLAIHYQNWLTQPAVDIPDLDGIPPISAAEAVRSDWGLGNGVAPNLIPP